jgi:hypothetical protein
VNWQRYRIIAIIIAILIFIGNSGIIHGEGRAWAVRQGKEPKELATECDAPACSLPYSINQALHDRIASTDA